MKYALYIALINGFLISESLAQTGVEPNSNNLPKDYRLYNDEIAETIYEFWDLIWSNKYAQKPLYFIATWHWAEPLKSRERSLQRDQVIFTLRVHRIEWFKLTSYQQEEIIFNVYKVLWKDFKQTFGDTEKCPLLIFELGDPRVNNMKVADINCKEFRIF